MKKKKEVVAMLLTAAMTIVFSACGGSSGGSTARSDSSTGASSGSGQVNTESSSAAATGNLRSANSDPVNSEVSDKTLVIGLMSEPSNLWDAGMGTTQNENEIIGSCLRDNLVTKDPETGKVVPDLATEWKWTDDTHLQFTLRDDVKFMDGSTMTADDIVYNVETWMQNSPATDTGRYLSGATADDDTHVTIAFNIKAPALLDMLTWDNFGIVGKNEVDGLGGAEAAAKNPLMGSGKSGKTANLSQSREMTTTGIKTIKAIIRKLFLNSSTMRLLEKWVWNPVMHRWLIRYPSVRHLHMHLAGK